MDRLTAENLFAAIATYAIEHDSFVTKTKLLKLLYLFDVEYYRVHRRTFTEFKWKFYHLGPWTAEFDPLFTNVIASGALREYYGKYETPMLRADAKVDPASVFTSIRDEVILRSVLNTWGAVQTNEILDKAYFGTEPMIHGIRNELLDFSTIPVERPPQYKRTSSGTDRRRIATLRAQFEIARNQRAFDISSEPITPPNYDEAFESAMKIMDSDEGY